MNLPDHIHPVAVEESLLNIGMSINEIRALTNTPAPQTVHTIEELEALNPDTVVILMHGGIAFTSGIIAASNAGYDEESALPAVVVATGAQVRAARTALQEDTE